MWKDVTFVLSLFAKSKAVLKTNFDLSENSFIKLSILETRNNHDLYMVTIEKFSISTKKFVLAL